MITRTSLICFAIIILFATGSPAVDQSQPETPSRPAVPDDPVDAIIKAFETYNVVALDEGNHGNIPGYEFRLTLLRDPRFPETVNDIVVECGNSLYQDIMDRFTSGGDVTYDELKQVWQKTTVQTGVCNSPIYEEFFRAVRDLNDSLPISRQIRVLLGDPPVDRDRQSDEEYLRLSGQRDSYPVELIKREVFSKSRHALVVYGGMHLLRKRPYFPISDQTVAARMNSVPIEATSIVAGLESEGVKVYSIWTDASDELINIQPEIASWETPSLALLKDTVLGQSPFTTVYQSKVTINYPDTSGKLKEETVSIDPMRSGLMQEQFDAILILGPESNMKLSR